MRKIIFILVASVILMLSCNDAMLEYKWDEAFGRLATFERQAEWEAFVGKFQLSKEGARSEEKWQLMERIFSLNEPVVCI